jgi:hypothetical protein
MKKTRILVMLALMFCLPFTAEARYAPLSLVDLAGGADIIVTGTIAEVGEADFELKIDTVIHGDSSDAKKAITITVQKFKDWACAARWGAYTPGESVLLFLTNADGKFSIMGAGGEGELFIHEGAAYFSRGRNPQGIDVASVEVNGTAIHGAKMTVDTLVDAIQGLHRMYSFSPGASFGQVAVEARESDLTHADFVATSPTHKALGEEAASRVKQ